MPTMWQKNNNITSSYDFSFVISSEKCKAESGFISLKRDSRQFSYRISNKKNSKILMGTYRSTIIFYNIILDLKNTLNT
jgi:hypothetical protein